MCLTRAETTDRHRGQRCVDSRKRKTTKDPATETRVKSFLEVCGGGQHAQCPSVSDTAALAQGHSRRGRSRETQSAVAWPLSRHKPRSWRYRTAAERMEGQKYPLVGTKVVTSRATFRLLWGVGFGVSGQVYAAEDISTGEQVAVKVCRIQAEPDKQQRAEREWKIALKLNHVNVLALRLVHINDSYIFMVMDLCEGGELFDRVSRSGGLSEDVARYYFKQIVAGLSYCHEQHVWHRDLKLENLLTVDHSTDSLVKIADFGLSKDAEMSSVDTSCGTVSYMAPEICLLQPGQIYDEAKSDIWSLGVILYVMRCCAYPFGHDGRRGERTDIVFARAMRRRWKNPGQLESKCSESLQDLIKSMLAVEPEKRLSMDGIQKHPWFLAGKPYVPPPSNRARGQGPVPSPQMSPHWQWPISAPAPEPFKGGGGAASPPLFSDNFTLGDGGFLQTPPRRSHSLLSRRPEQDDGPKNFCLMVRSDDPEFTDVFSAGDVLCKLTASTADELQTGIAGRLGLPDTLHVWYTEPSFGVPAVILDLAVLPCEATVLVRRREDMMDNSMHSPKSPKQNPIIKRLRKELVDLTRNAPEVGALPHATCHALWSVHSEQGQCRPCC